MQKCLCARALHLRSFGHRRYYTKLVPAFISLCLVSIYTVMHYSQIMPQYEDMQLSLGCMIGSNASSRTKLPYQCKYLCSCSYISVVHAHHLTAIVYEIAVPIFQSPQCSRFGLVLTEIIKLCTVGHNIQACLFLFREMWFSLWKAQYKKHFYNLCRMSHVVM